jgi:hypothetical protein
MKTLLISLTLLTCGTFASAQYVEERASHISEESFAERLVFGGGLGANFGTGFTIVDVSPMIGYQLTDRLIPGVGLNYTYYRLGNQSFSIYGGSVWTRYMIADNFFAHTEYQQLNLPFYNFNNERVRAWVPMWLAGGGYHSGRGSGLGFSIMVLWDLIGDPRSPFQNPLVRGGVMMGF